MSVTVLASVRGAPGVTTTALLVAGCLGSGAVVEADLDGGVLAVRYGLGREPGLTTMAAARTATAEGWRDHAQPVGGVPVLVGPDSAALARSLWRRAGVDLAAALAAADADLVVDAGRLRADDLGPACSVASELLVLVRPEADHLATLAHRLDELRERTTRVGVVLAGVGPYRPGDVSEQLGVDVVGVIPDDVRAAACVGGRGGLPGTLARSRLARAVRTLTDAIVARVDTNAGPATAAAERPDGERVPLEEVGT